MLATIRLLMLFFVAFAGSEAFGVSVNDIIIEDTAPTYLQNFITIVLYLCLPILFAVLCAWSVWHAKDNNLQPAMITFGGMVLVVIGLLVFFGEGPGGEAYAGYATAREGFSTAYDWHTYGDTLGTPTHFASQAQAYEMQRGWALAGAVYWFRLIDVAFSFYIIPLVGIVGCLAAVYASRERGSPRPLITHLLAMMIAVPMFVLPTVELQSPITSNAMYRLILQTTAPTDDWDLEVPDDQPRVSPFIAVSFGVLTDMAERIGSRISFGDRGPNSIIVQASLDARLTSGDYDNYMRYASFCFTAVKSFSDARTSSTASAAYTDLYNEKLGSFAAPTPGGSVGNYLKSPLAARHALSPYSDAIFKDLWVQRWVYMDMIGGGNYQWLDRTYVVNEIPAEHSYHPNYHIGAGAVEQVVLPDLEPKKGVERLLPKHVGNHLPMAVTPNDVFGSLQIGNPRYVTFCSLRGFRGISDNYRDMATADKLPAVFAAELPSATDRSRFRPLAYDDQVRAAISRRYLADGAVNFCKGVSPDANNEYLWGCLIAGRYRNATTEKEKSMKEVQDLFDSRVRPALDGEIQNQINGAQVGGGVPAERLGPTPAYHTSGNYEVTSNTFDFLTYRHFTDMMFMAPGIQNQIGLHGDYSAAKGEDEETNTSNWFYSLLVSVGGFVQPGVAGIIAWIATAVTKICLMMYPHVLGVMTFILMLKSVPYLVRGIFFGQWLYPIVHLLPGIALICFMPVFIQIGLSFTELGSGFALPALFVRAQGGASFGESVLQIIGSFFIFGAFSLAATFMTLTFGSLAGLLGSVNSSAFKLTGAAASGIMAVAGIAAGGGTSALASAATNLVGKISGTKPDSTPAPGGGGGGGGGGGTPGPSSSTPRLTGPQSSSGGGSTTSGGTSPTGTNGAVTTHQGRKADDHTGTSQQQAADMKGQMASSQIPSAGGGGVGGGLTRGAAGVISLAGTALQHGTQLASSTTSSIASAISSGPEGAAISQGIQMGHSLGTSVSHSALDLASMGAGILTKDGRSYDELRGPDRKFLPSVPADDHASQNFSRTAQSAEEVANNAASSGELQIEREARTFSGDYYADAGRLASNPAAAGPLQIQAAKAYQKTGRKFDAELQLRLAEGNLRRAEPLQRSEFDRNNVQAALAEIQEIRNQLETQ